MKLASKLVMAVFVMLAWLGTSRAHAGIPGVVLIVVPYVDEYPNEIRSAVETSVRSAVEAALRNEGWSLPSKPPTKDDAKKIDLCLDDALKQRDSKQASACVRGQYQRVFVVKIVKAVKSAAPATSRTRVLWDVDLSYKGILIESVVTAIRPQPCPKCLPLNLANNSAQLVTAVLQDLVPPPKRSIELTSTPEVATVIFDGDWQGFTKLSIDAFPGKHRVTFEKPGYLSQTREVMVEDKALEIPVKLIRIDTDMPPLPSVPDPVSDPDPHAKRRFGPYFLLGMSVVGAALITIGSVWYFEYGREGPDDKYRYTRAKELGVAAAVVGIVTVGFGGYMWWRSRSSAPTFEATPTSVTVGWARTFR